MLDEELRQLEDEDKPVPLTWRQHVLAQLTSFPARVTGTLICLFVLASHIDVPAAARILAQARAEFIFLGLALQIPILACAIAEWAVLIECPEGNCVRQLCWAYLKGIAPSQLLPTGLAGDVVRIYETSKFTDMHTAAASVAVSRISSCTALLIWGAFAAFLLRGTLGMVPFTALLAAAVVLFSVCATAFLTDGLLARLVSLVKRFNVKAAKQMVLFLQEMRGYRRQMLRLSLSFLVSLLGWSFQFAAVACFAAATGASVPYSFIAVGSALALFASAVPFALNGMGLREGILIGVLTQSGLPATHGAAVAVLVDLQLAPLVVLSIIVWWFAKKEQLQVPQPKSA